VLGQSAIASGATGQVALASLEERVIHRNTLHHHIGYTGQHLRGTIRSPSWVRSLLCTSPLLHLDNHLAHLGIRTASDGMVQLSQVVLDMELASEDLVQTLLVVGLAK
jgi:hypothetical protein